VVTMVKTCSRIRRGYFLAPLTRTTMRSGRLTRGSYEDQRGIAFCRRHDGVRVLTQRRA
jgi:hypothetical protein